jgi:hypothetical protein
VRFVFAIICFVLAALAMGLGIAERTVLAGPDQVSVSTTANDKAPVVVIDGSALNAYPHTQTVELGGSASAFAAYGRTSDVLAWVGDANYTRVTFDAKTGKLVSRLHAGTTNTVPDPSGSDLWLAQYTGGEANNFNVKVPSDISIIAVSNGTSPAPSKVTLSWPVDNDVPWSDPVILVGAILLVIGLVLLLWAFTHLRKSRGPRRTQSRMPKLPKQPRYKPTRKSIGRVTPPSTKGRRSISRFVAAAPLVATATMVLAGCTGTPAPVIPTPTPAATTAAVTKAQETAVTPTQLQEIMQRVSSTVTTADGTSGATLLATRMEGPALQERLANYQIRKADPKIAPSVAIPATTIGLTLPQASDAWPRTVFTVVQNKASKTAAPVALMLVQADPRSNYKVDYAVTLQPGVVLPEVAPAKIGAVRMSPDVKLLELQPSALALAYGDVLVRDTASPSNALFDPSGDTFRTQVGAASKRKQQKDLPSTAKLTFANVAGPGQVIALATVNSGAIAAVDLNEVETVRPVKTGAAVSAKGATKALSGKATSTKGIVATYGDQLLFYVPPAGKSGKIVLLGYSQGLIQAAEYKKK